MDMTDTLPFREQMTIAVVDRRPACLKASHIRVQRAPEPGEPYGESKFLLVETTLDAQDRSVTRIEYFCSEGAPEGRRLLSERRVHGLRLTHPVALEWATAYAARHGIPVVYQREDAA